MEFRKPVPELFVPETDYPTYAKKFGKIYWSVYVPFDEYTEVSIDQPKNFEDLILYTQHLIAYLEGRGVIDIPEDHVGFCLDAIFNGDFYDLNSPILSTNVCTKTIPQRIIDHEDKEDLIPTFIPKSVLDRLQTAERQQVPFRGFSLFGEQSNRFQFNRVLQAYFIRTDGWYVPVILGAWKV